MFFFYLYSVAIGCFPFMVMLAAGVNDVLAFVLCSLLAMAICWPVYCRRVLGWKSQYFYRALNSEQPGFMGFFVFIRPWVLGLVFIWLGGVTALLSFVVMFYKEIWEVLSIRLVFDPGRIDDKEETFADLNMRAMRGDIDARARTGHIGDE
jgi:hypothetical protein